MKHLVRIDLEFETNVFSGNLTPEMEKKLSQTLAFITGTSGVRDVYARLGRQFHATLTKFQTTPLGVVGEDVSPMPQEEELTAFLRNKALPPMEPYDPAAEGVRFQNGHEYFSEGHPQKVCRCGHKHVPVPGNGR